MLKERIKISNYSHFNDHYLSLTEWKILINDFIDEYGLNSLLSFSIEGVKLYIVKDLLTFKKEEQSFIPEDPLMFLRDWRDTIIAIEEWYKEDIYLISEDIDVNLIVSFG